MLIHPFNLDQAVAERHSRLFRRAGQVTLPGRRDTGRGADGQTGTRRS